MHILAAKGTAAALLRQQQDKPGQVMELNWTLDNTSWPNNQAWHSSHNTACAHTGRRHGRYPTSSISHGHIWLEGSQVRTLHACLY